MPEQRRIGYRWNLRALMAKRNLWKTTELMPLPPKYQSAA